MDPETLKKFRPVSNLKFVSKIEEKVAASRLAEYISLNNLCEQFQSAYRKKAKESRNRDSTSKST